MTLRRHRAPRAAAAALVATLLLAGCSLIPHSKLYDPPAAKPGVRQGGVLRIGIGQPQGIEPAAAYEPYGRMITSLICEPLLSIDPVSGAVRPALAQSFSLADDGQTIFLTLHHGLRFANGDKLDTGAIYTALNRLASPDYQSYVAGLLSEVQGYGEYHDQTSSGGVAGGKSSALSQIQIIDTWSVRIHLSVRDPSFLRVLADPATAPIDPHALDADPARFAQDPVCLGPYQLAKPWSPDDRLITLVRNPAYTPADAAFTDNGRPLPKEIDFSVYPNAAAELAAYGAGTIDVAADPGTDVTSLLKTYGSAVQTGPGTMIDFLSFPAATPPFDNADLRVALSEALNRTDLAATYAGDREPFSGFVPPAAGEDGYQGTSCSTAPKDGDLPAARASLAKSGVDLAGRSINLYYDDEFGHAALVKQIAAQWHTAFGVTVVPKPMTWDTYIQQAATGASFNGPFLESWDAAPYRAVDYLQPLLTRQGLGHANLSRYDGPDVVALMQTEMPQISTQNDQDIVLRKLDQFGCRDLPLTPLLLHRATVLVRGDAVGSARGPYLALDGQPMLRELYVRTQGERP